MGNAILGELGRADSISGQVDNSVRVDERGILQSGLDNKLSILNEDVLVGDGSLFELTIASEIVSLECN